MKPEDLLKLLEENRLTPVNNQACIDSMSNGYEATSLYGSPPNAENLISGAFTNDMPNANPSQEVTSDIQNTVTFNIPELS